MAALTSEASHDTLWPKRPNVDVRPPEQLLYRVWQAVLPLPVKP